MTKKGAVQVGLIEVIGIVLGVILIIGISYTLAKTIGGLTKKAPQSEIAFDGLVAKINQLLQDPSPLAYSIVPLFLSDDYVVIGYTEGRVQFLSCPFKQSEELLAPKQPCGQSTCLCLGLRFPAGGDFSQQLFKSHVKCIPLGKIILYQGLDEAPRPHPFREKALGKDIAFPYSISFLRHYREIKELLLAAACGGSFGQQSVYIEKHELPTGETILYFGYGDERAVSERIKKIHQSTRIEYAQLAKQKFTEGKPSESLALLQRESRYPLLTTVHKQRIFVDSCYYSFVSHDYFQSIHFCKEALALEEQVPEKEKLKPAARNTIHYVLARALTETGEILKAFYTYTDMIKNKRYEGIKIPLSEKDIPLSKFLDDFKGLAQSPARQTLSVELLLDLAKNYQEITLEKETFTAQALELYKFFLERYPTDEKAPDALYEIARITNAPEDIQKLLKTAPSDSILHAKGLFLQYQISQTPERIALAEQLLKHPQKTALTAEHLRTLTKEIGDFYYNQLQTALPEQKEDIARKARAAYELFQPKFDASDFQTNLNLIDLTTFLSGPAAAIEEAKTIFNNYIEKKLQTEATQIQDTINNLQKELELLNIREKELKENTQLIRAHELFLNKDYRNAALQYTVFFITNKLEEEQFRHVIAFADATCRAAFSYYHKAQEEIEQDQQTSYNQCVSYGTYCMTHTATEKKDVEPILQRCTAAP